MITLLVSLALLACLVIAVSLIQHVNLPCPEKLRPPCDIPLCRHCDEFVAHGEGYCDACRYVMKLSRAQAESILWAIERDLMMTKKEHTHGL